ncbi:PAS domain-containing protein [Ferrovibrio sp.]|uniref:PAS domain-containing protein n=1 Tax=Ferrovibrio sp. TaxID=1917215 RepID=UPI00260E0E98|nr:PAS domain-containing protein [Ferrovibrio sp.]
MEHGLASLIVDMPDAKLQAVARHWMTLHYAGGGIPRLRAVDALQLGQALSDIWILDLHDDGMPRVHLAGETLADWFGRCLKGLRLSEIYNADMLPLILNMVRQVSETPAILLQQAHSLPTNRSFTVPFHRLALPLCDDAGAIRHVLGISVFSSRAGHGQGPVRTSIERERLYPLRVTAAERAASTERAAAMVA